MNCQPARIVLFEQGEFQLYTIDRELQRMAEASGIPVTARLGSVTDKTRVASVIADEGVEIILHAAAYKHVPLVEDNPLEGARNNVIGTQTVAEAADAAGVERMILVSTDKAVRPTNIIVPVTNRRRRPCNRDPSRSYALFHDHPRSRAPCATGRCLCHGR